MELDEWFLSPVSTLTRDIDIAILSVHLSSVRLSVRNTQAEHIIIVFFTIR